MITAVVGIAVFALLFYATHLWIEWESSRW